MGCFAKTCHSLNFLVSKLQISMCFHQTELLNFIHFILGMSTIVCFKTLVTQIIELYNFLNICSRSIIQSAVKRFSYLFFFSGLAAPMSADIARNLRSLVCSCLNGYSTFHLFPLLIFFSNRLLLH